MAFGLTSTGFNMKRLEDIKTELETEYKAVFGNIDVNPDSIFGQLIGIDAKREADLWELLANLYASTSPASAEGIALDHVVQLNNMLRLPATKSYVKTVLKGEQDTIVPQYTQAKMAANTTIFELIDVVTIGKSNAFTILLSIKQVENAHEYLIQLDGVDYSYTSDSNATIAEILSGLSLSIEGIAPDITTLVDLDEETLSIQCTDFDSTGFAIVVDEDDFEYENIGAIGTFQATIVGAISVPEQTLTSIVTPVTGLDSIINLIPGITGRNIETDAELRLRRKLNTYPKNGSTIEAMRSRLLTEVSGVSNVLILENDSDVIVDSRPPHSIECVVFGGDAQTIANKIWQVKPAGIQTYGGLTYTVTDVYGASRTVKFSRATNKYIWIKYTITEDTEQSFPADGEVQIQNDTLSFCNAQFTIGSDILIQKLISPVFLTPGVRSVVVEIAATLTSDGVPSYGTVDIIIDSLDVPVFSVDRITVVV